MTTILVLCTGNSCRSQIAEGYLRHYGDENITVISAGIVANGLNPRAVSIMKEDGIDIARQTSNTIAEFQGQYFDYVITVCDNAKENCPTFLNVKHSIHHNFRDPAGATGNEESVLATFRSVREDIKAFVRVFLKTID